MADEANATLWGGVGFAAGFVAGFGCRAIAGIPGAAISEYIKRPVQLASARHFPESGIEATFSRDSAGCVLNTPEDYLVEGDPNPHRHNVVYARIRVRNVATRQLVGCRAHVTAVDRWEQGFYRPTHYADRLLLIWSFNAPVEAMSIPKDVSQFVDVMKFAPDYPVRAVQPCFRRSGDHREYTPNAYEELFRTAGRYRLTVVVSADSMESRTVLVEYEWHGGRPTFPPPEI